MKVVNSINEPGKFAIDTENPRAPYVADGIADYQTAELLAAAPELLRMLRCALANPEYLAKCRAAYWARERYEVTPGISGDADEWQSFAETLAKFEGIE